MINLVVSFVSDLIIVKPITVFVFSNGPTKKFIVRYLFVSMTMFIKCKNKRLLFVSKL